MNKQTIQSKDKIAPAVFYDLNLAWSFADRCNKPMMVLFGDCPQYWVVTPADAERLMRGGYEPAPRV